MIVWVCEAGGRILEWYLMISPPSKGSDSSGV